MCRKFGSVSSVVQVALQAAVGGENLVALAKLGDKLRSAKINQSLTEPERETNVELLDGFMSSEDFSDVRTQTDAKDAEGNAVYDTLYSLTVTLTAEQAARTKDKSRFYSKQGITGQPVDDRYGRKGDIPSGLHCRLRNSGLRPRSRRCSACARTRSRAAPHWPAASCWRQSSASRRRRWAV